MAMFELGPWSLVWIGSPSHSELQAFIDVISVTIPQLSLKEREDLDCLPPNDMLIIVNTSKQHICNEFQLGPSGHCPLRHKVCGTGLFLRIGLSSVQLLEVSCT